MRPLVERRRLGARLRRFRSDRGGAAAILIYHRVSDRDLDPQLQCVGSERFDEQMRLIAQEFQPVSVRDLADCIEQHERIPDRSVAVTFDDGYLDNLTTALPILRRHGVPATIFVNSGLTGRVNWVDRLEQLLLRPVSLPDRLTIHGPDARPITYDLAEDRSCSPDPSWNVTLPPVSGRHAAYMTICELLRAADHDRRGAILESLATQVEADISIDNRDRMVTQDEIRLLAEDELITIGAHTAHHRLLSAASEVEQVEEIRGDRIALQKMSGTEVDLFSYPYGGPGDYTSLTMKLVSDSGFRLACANHPGPVSPWTNPLRTPRLPLSRLSCAEFMRVITEWLTTGSGPA